MTVLYDFLVEHVFGGFLQQDISLLNEIDNAGCDIYIVDEQFIFTLPALFELTCNAFEAAHHQPLSRSRPDYLRFRKQLYSNPTNTLLSHKGGIVKVNKPAKDLDHSTYKLIYIGAQTLQPNRLTKNPSPSDSQ